MLLSCEARLGSFVAPHNLLPHLSTTSSGTSSSLTPSSSTAAAEPAATFSAPISTNDTTVPLPPLLSPESDVSAADSNRSNSYGLNLWTGRIQLHMGRLFENLVQASAPSRNNASSALPCDVRNGLACMGGDSAAASTARSLANDTAGSGGGGGCDCGCGGNVGDHNVGGSGNGESSNATSTTSSSASSTSSSSSSSSAGQTSMPLPVPTRKPDKNETGSLTSCFPALDFNMPADVPNGGLDGWWCSMKDEYAFLGFSYDLSSCPSLQTLRTDFKRMRSEFNSRYVRLYSSCDRASMNDDLIAAAWESGLGLHMLIWFGFDGGDQWRTRKRDLLRTIKSNPRAPYVVRAVVVGSEPLFDSVLEPDQLAEQIMDVKNKLSNYTGKGLDGMQVTLSEMPYGFMSHGNAPSVFKAMDVVEGNVLPFFDQRATTGGQAWSLVTSAYTYFQKQAKGKKVLYTQIGWPSNDSCAWFKSGVQGGVGWFAHIYNDDGLPGWGVLDGSGKLKFEFAPQTTC
ncbi:hypothetical protein OC845_002753 [Tilletia horrida]|nr:hypothetical protein OC845_002753 [Tilletia horrida]